MNADQLGVMDDNLITRRKNIMQAIESIRQKKSEVAQALRELNIGKPTEDPEVKNSMRQLLEAFDAISKQENQYMDILQTIVNLHQQATLDVAKDFEQKIEKDAQKLAEVKDKIEEAEEEKREKTPEELANAETMAELHEALLELKKVQEAAVAAAELNEKLVERFQLQKKKRNAMSELREKKAKELDEEATKVRAEVVERINKMTSLKKTTTKQEKELKELQKQCLQLGLQLDTNPVDQEAQEALLDDNQRVPMIAETQERAELNEEEKEKRREEIRESIKKEMEKKEQVNTLIREKLASMDARRKRLQQIRKMLEQQEEQKEQLNAQQPQTGEGIQLTPETPRQSLDVPEESEPMVEKSLDDILENAKASLNKVTAMRERLEHIKETGGADLNDDDLQLLQNLEELGVIDDAEPPEEVLRAKLTEAREELQNNDDIESAVRECFRGVFEQKKSLVLAENQLEMMNAARRAALEDMIRKIDEKLPGSPSSSPSLSLLSLEADELRELSALLLRLADLKNGQEKIEKEATSEQ